MASDKGDPELQEFLNIEQQKAQFQAQVKTQCDIMSQFIQRFTQKLFKIKETVTIVTCVSSVDSYFLFMNLTGVLA